MKFFTIITICTLGVVSSTTNGKNVNVNPKNVNDWNIAMKTLTKCYLPMANCQVNGGLGVVPITNQKDCENNNNNDELVWTQAYKTNKQLQKDSDKTNNLINGRKGVYFGILKKDKVWVEKDGITLADIISCGEQTIVIVDGKQKDLEQYDSNIMEFAAALPTKLKNIAILEEYEKQMEERSTSPTKTISRKILLSPSSTENAQQILNEWTIKHNKDRRVLKDGTPIKVEFSTEKPRRKLNQNGGHKYRQHVIKVTTNGPAEILDLIEQEIECVSIEPEIEMKVSNLDAALVTQGGLSLPRGSNTDVDDSKAPIWSADIRGQGQVVGVGDSGLDTNHCLFRDDNGAHDRNRQPGRTYNTPNARKVIQYVASADGTDPVAGHGTHVAGSVAGNPLVKRNEDSNSRDPKRDKGMAPEATIAFYDMGRSDNPLSIFPPNDLGDMFDAAATVGAQIHTNSWGGNSNTYTSNSRQVDAYAFENQEYLILFAAGNGGYKSTGSLGTPATCKNCISVGASLNADRMWGRVSQSCPANTNKRSCIEYMADFSSNGPTSDNRIKPDLTAPGHMIVSAHANPNAETCNYATKSGTSMATPVVAGSAALVRNFLMDGMYPTGIKNEKDAFKPMGALVKALLINGADTMEGSYNGRTLKAFDGFQGFGRIHLANNLLVDGNQDGRSVFLDGDVDNMSKLRSSRDEKTYTLKIVNNPSTDLKVTLVWWDFPASAFARDTLINDLDVSVTTESGKKHIFPNGGSSFDRVNTVEHLVVSQSSLRGESSITVTVSAHKIAQGPQPFALVVSGPLVLEENIPSPPTTSTPTTSSPTTSSPTTSTPTESPSPKPTRSPTPRPTKRVRTSRPSKSPTERPTRFSSETESPTLSEEEEGDDDDDDDDDIEDDIEDDSEDDKDEGYPGPPNTWLCPVAWWFDDDCDCACGAWDPKCDNPDARLYCKGGRIQPSNVECSPETFQCFFDSAGSSKDEFDSAMFPEKLWDAEDLLNSTKNLDPSDSQLEDDSSLTTLILIVVSCFLFVLILGFLLTFCIVRRRRSRQNSTAGHNNNNKQMAIQSFQV